MELLHEVERLRGVILESSQQATDALVALAADEHAWRPAIRVLASIAQREASSLATAGTPPRSAREVVGFGTKRTALFPHVLRATPALAFRLPPDGSRWPFDGPAWLESDYAPPAEVPWMTDLVAR